MGNRGVIGDKWSMRVIWVCAIGSAIGLYMVAVERQKQNRDRMMAESLSAMESEVLVVYKSNDSLHLKWHEKRPKVGKMASLTKSAFIILSVFLSLGFSLAHRFLLDQANDVNKKMDPPHPEAVKPNGGGVGIGYGKGGGSGEGGLGYGEGRGIGSGPGGIGYGKGMGIGSGIGPGDVPGITIPIPQIPGIPGCVNEPCYPCPPIAGCSPGNNCQPPYYEHQNQGSATETAKEMQEAKNIASEPFPPDEDHNQP
ncbi:hypothetical protein REPUB_Repub11eG0062400 [Reevesia pubescens]